MLNSHLNRKQAETIRDLVHEVMDGLVINSTHINNYKKNQQLQLQVWLSEFIKVVQAARSIDLTRQAPQQEVTLTRQIAYTLGQLQIVLREIVQAGNDRESGSAIKLALVAIRSLQISLDRA